MRTNVDGVPSKNSIERFATYVNTRRTTFTGGRIFCVCFLFPIIFCALFKLRLFKLFKGHVAWTSKKITPNIFVDVVLTFFWIILNGCLNITWVAHVKWTTGRIAVVRICITIIKRIRQLHRSSIRVTCCKGHGIECTKNDFRSRCPYQ